MQLVTVPLNENVNNRHFALATASEGTVHKKTTISTEAEEKQKH
jgi:hypothetical protein